MEMSKEFDQVPVPPTFLLEWFFKSLVPQLSKDVATSRVFFEEDTIMRAQQLELIYSQSGILYEIFPDAPRSILDKTRKRSGPHVDGIIGYKPVDPFSTQLQQFSIQQSMANQTTGSVAPPTQNSDVHSVKMTNPKATQQPDGKKKQWKKGKEDKKPIDNASSGDTEKEEIKVSL
jgi:hypothetical protein